MSTDADTDVDLVAAASGGDREAFASIYDRYADRIHDFCHSMLRDREEAADTMQDTFLVATQRLAQLREPARLKAWLYAIARHECLRRIRARNRLSYGDDLTELPARGAGPDEEAQQGELRELVWSAAAGLNERDQALMDLHVRQGLDGQDLADAMGVSASHSYVLLTRLRDQVERSLGALLVARTGSEDCTELAAVLGDWDGRFSPLMRKRVARHVDDCDVCGDRRRTMASPMALMGAVPLLAAPAELRDRVLGAFDLKSYDQALVTGSGRHFDRRGFPTDRRQRRLRIAAVSVAVLLPLLLIGGLLVIVTAGESPPPLVAGVGEVSEAPAPSATPPSSTPSVAPTASPTAAAVAGGRLVIAPSTLLFARTVNSRLLTLTNTGGQPLPWSAVSDSFWITVSPGSGTIAPGGSVNLVVSADRSSQTDGTRTAALGISVPSGVVTVAVSVVVDRPPTISGVTADQPALRTSAANCGATSAVVVAGVTDSQAVTSVTLHWNLDGGGTAPMGGGSGSYKGVLGPFKQAGTLIYWVVATDSAGQPTQSKQQQMPVLDKC